MRQFEYVQVIPMHSSVFARLKVLRRDLDAIFNDLYAHLVLDKARSVPTNELWTYEHGYIQ